MPDSHGQMTIAEREAEITELDVRIANPISQAEAEKDTMQRAFALEMLRRLKADPKY